MDLINKQLYTNDDEIKLTKKEYKLVELFFRKPNEMITYEMIENYIWSEKKMNKNSNY